MTYQVTSPFWQFVDHWQTLIAGVLAVLAAAATIYFTMKAAKWEVDAANEQIRTSIRAERARIARESLAFFSMLDAALGFVVQDIETARGSVASPQGDAYSADVYEARQRVKKVGFDELRAAMIGLGGPLSAPFLQLDRMIDEFRADWIETMPRGQGLLNKRGRTANFDKQLNEIAEQVIALRGLVNIETARCNSSLAKVHGLIDSSI